MPFRETPHGKQESADDFAASRWCNGSTTILRVFAAAAAAAALAVSLPVTAAAQDPSWAIVRPNITWDNDWKVEPAPQALFSVLDEPIYVEEQPVVARDRAVATRPQQRFEVGFSDNASSVERFDGGQVWVYMGIRKRTRVDLAIRTRRNGRVTIVSSRNRQTPPITLAPEDPPVGRNGFRGWVPLSLPSLTRAEANHLSLALRISPTSPTDSLGRVYAALAELYPGS